MDQPIASNIDDLLTEGWQQQQAGRMPQAERCFRAVLDKSPNHTGALHMLGLLTLQMGKPADAAELIGRVVAIQPDDANACTNLSQCLRIAGRRDEAVRWAQRAVELNPNFPEARANLAIALQEAGNPIAAIDQYQQAIRLKPTFVAAVLQLSPLLQAAGRHEEAVGLLQSAAVQNPNDPEVHFQLGWLLRTMARTDQAIDSLRRAITLAPAAFNAFNELGNALGQTGRLAEAAAAYQQAVRLLPDFAPAQSNLGVTLANMGHYDQAIAAHRAAVAAAPNAAAVHVNLAKALLETGRQEEAIAEQRTALQLEPGTVQAFDGLLMNLHYNPDITAQQLLVEHRRYDQAYCQPLAAGHRPHTNVADPDRSLRIGYVSGDFWDHCVGRFMAPLLAHHDPSQVQVFCYPTMGRSDDVTRRLHASAQAWRPIWTLSDDTAAEMIRSDGIDILVDLSLHTHGNRLLLFARKPAPVQVSYLGYASTTGVSAIDYRLTDPHIDPPGETDADYSERLVRLPSTWWCYGPPVNAPEPAAPPSAKNGYVTFGCLNNFAKISKAAFALWADVLKSVPDARLLMLASGAELSARARATFAEFGIAPNRLEFVGRQRFEDYLATYHRVDIALDPMPFNGGTTTCDALWMGVPIITLSGSTGVSRVGRSVLTNVGLNELIATDAAGYLRIATNLAGDRPRLIELRADLRNRMRQSPLIDARQFARDIESAYRWMWRQWCNARLT